MDATAFPASSASPPSAPVPSPAQAGGAAEEVLPFRIPTGVAFVARRSQIEARPSWRVLWEASFVGQRKDWRYYEIVEDTLRQGFEHYYLVLEDERGVARAIQPFFLLDQDMLAGAGGFVRAIVRPVRKLFPRFLSSRTLMVGCAAGEGCLHDGGEAPAGGEAGEWVARSLHAALAAYARRARVKLVVLKEFPADFRRPLAYFARNGYLRVPSLPYTRLSLHYRDFDEYLTKALSKATRKNLRRKFKSAEEASKDRPVEMSVVSDLTPFVDEAYPLYQQVLGRSKLQFEKLTQDYFSALGRRMGDKARFFLWRREGRLVAFSACLVHGDSLSDEYLGMDYAVAPDLNLYFTTLRDVFQWMMAHGVRWYYSSAMGYDPKLHLRCELAPVDLYVRHTSAVMNFFLRRFLPFLEPTRGHQVLPHFSNYADVWGKGGE